MEPELHHQPDFIEVTKSYSAVLSTTALSRSTGLEKHK